MDKKGEIDFECVDMLACNVRFEAVFSTVEVFELPLMNVSVGLPGLGVAPMCLKATCPVDENSPAEFTMTPKRHVPKEYTTREDESARGNLVFLFAVSQ